MRKRYDLCILIPAFNFVPGVAKILSLVGESERIAVIISDDSTDQDMATDIERIANYPGNKSVFYFRGPGNGAIANWNSLLQKVNAEYFTLMHHDEVWTDIRLLDTLRATIREAQTRCFVLPCEVKNDVGIVRRISSASQQRMHKYFSDYLPYYNYLGPTAVLVVHRSFIQLFDENLEWFVDVEWFHRIFGMCANDSIVFVDGSTRVISSIYGGSITASMQPKIADVVSSELSYLGSRGHKVDLLRWKMTTSFLLKPAHLLSNFRAYLEYWLATAAVKIKWKAKHHGNCLK